MKRLNLIIAAVTLFAAATFSITPASANGVDEILNNMRNAAKGIKTVRAILNQEKKNTQLGGPPERYSGAIVIQRGERQGSEKVKIKYTNGQEIAVVGNQITLYQPSINQVLITTRQKIGNENKDISFVATPFSSVDDLKAKFNIEYRGDEGGLAKLELQPKNPNLQPATIWVDRNSWLPTKFKVIEKQSKNESFFTLTQVSPNSPVKSDEFKVNYPPGTKVIKQ